MIGAVILNYNTYPETIRLVEALQRQTIAADLRIVIVDNASPNGSFARLQQLEKKFDHVYVLQTGENLGYAKGNNFGLEYLDKHIKPEYAAVLNNDIVLPNDCFEKLIEKYQLLENPCIIAPIQLDTERKVSIMGNLPRFTDDMLNLSYIYRRIRKHRVKVIDNTGRQAMKVDVITGSLMFFALARFKEIGYFHPGTFLYAEERFVAYSAKQYGYNNYVLTDENYIHKHAVTIASLHSAYDRYKMCYDSWLEYTRVCRKNGKIKAVVLKPLIQLSLFEIKVVSVLRNFYKIFR